MHIAFIGLGAMGLPMARRLVEAGHDVRGHDVTAAARERFSEAGGTLSGSIEKACDGADALFLMVVNADQTEGVLFDEGAARALPEGALVIACCTQPPARAEDCGRRLAASGLRLLDAPVSGGTAGAEGGTLTIMAGGPRETFEAARPILEILGDKLHHVGEAWGQGSTMKTVNQLMCGAHIAVAAEALALGRAAGIDGGLMLEILGKSAAASWMLNDRGPRMLQHDPEVRSAVDIFVKDLGIVLDAGREGKTPTPIASLAYQLFLAASARDLGRADDSQLVRVFEELSGRAEQ